MDSGKDPHFNSDASSSPGDSRHTIAKLRELGIRNVVVTGGAGFIGSALVSRLNESGVDVTVLDNFSSAAVTENFLKSIPGAGKVSLVRGDCTNSTDISECLKGVDALFHLSANPEVRLERSNEETCVTQNVLATFRVLEAFKRSSARVFAFTSSSTVYGEPSIIPTPENYGPLIPISVYGASKLASEALISAFARSNNKRAVIFRLANIVGERSQHGVIPDFVRKMHMNPNLLEVLGDGSQTKSYLHVDDCVSAILTGTALSDDPVAIYNVGATDFIQVDKIAAIVARMMGHPQTKIEFTGGVDNGRGWIGDVKKMLLNVRAIERLGWKPDLSSEESINLTIKRIIERRTNESQQVNHTTGGRGATA